MRVVVSPHLDDAILSLGGSIAAWTAAGERVVIATIYTTGPTLARLAPSMRKFADYATRRREDATAAAVVGAEVCYLDQVERAFRRPYLTGWSFFTTPPGRDGFATLANVTRALAGVLRAPEHIYVPFGIGNHVDHVEALVAATDVAHAGSWLDRVRFYEDFYALSGRIRRGHPIAKSRLWRGWQAPLLHARRLALVLQTIAAARRGPDVLGYLAPPLRDARWAVERSPMAAYEARKLDAIRCYASQTRAFGGRAGITRALHAYHVWWGGAEPLWRPNLR
jgi:LmbE family N-acetylglucosaminyl deacetylase